MPRYEVWVHRREGWEFLVRLEGCQVTGVRGPLDIEELAEPDRWPGLAYDRSEAAFYRFREYPEQFHRPRGLRLSVPSE